MNIFYFAIIMAEKLKKGSVKIGEVQREKIAGKLEDVMCRCRRAKAEETMWSLQSGVGGMIIVLVFQGWQRSLL